MKLLRKPIEMIAWFDLEGNPIPIKFRYLTNDKEFIKIKINRVIEKQIDKFAGNKMIKYKCTTIHNNVQKVFELRYELDTCKWYLYKM